MIINIPMGKVGIKEIGQAESIIRRLSELSFPITLIIHDADMDGYTAAALLLLTLGKHNFSGPIVLWPMIHGDTADTFSLEAFSSVKEKVPMVSIDGAYSALKKKTVNTTLPSISDLVGFDVVFVLDHTYSQKLKEALPDTTKLVYIDHHPLNCAVPDDVVYITGVYDGDVCGASTTGLTGLIAKMATGQGFDNVLYTIVDMVDHHDAWKYGTRTEALDTLTKQYTTSFYSSDAALNLTVTCCRVALDKLTVPDGMRSAELNNVLVIGSSIDEARARDRTTIIKNMHTLGELGIVLHHGDYDYIAKEAFATTECRLMVIGSMRGDRLKCSVRSSPDAIVSAGSLANAFGGGGHSQAAGFYIDPTSNFVASIRDAYTLLTVSMTEDAA